MKLYGYTVVDTGGEFQYNGEYRESSTNIYLNEKEMKDALYSSYLENYKILKENEEIEEDCEKVSKKEFLNFYPESLLIQCNDFHLQFEPWCYEI